MFVSSNAFKPFEHLVSFDTQAAVRGVSVGENIAPNRMGVQHSASWAKTNHRKVQQRLSRRPAVAFEHIAGAVDLQNVISLKLAFVDAAGGDREAQWLAADDRAEVAAGAENPATVVKVWAQSSKARGRFFERSSVDSRFSAKPISVRRR